MKAQTKAIVASVVVIALALAAVSGVTYSWFSDTESSDINVSTAKIDIKGEFTESNVTGAGATGVNRTVAPFADNSLEIQNLVASTKVTSTYSVTNNSTVSTTYRMYVAIDDSNLPTFVSMKVTAYNPVLNVTDQSLAFTDGIAYIVGGDDEGEPLATGVGPLSFTFVIATEEAFSTSFNSTIKIVCEAYQSDYTYTEPQVISSTGTAAMPASPSSDITFKGTAPASGASASPSDIEIVFTKEAASEATGGASNVVLKTEMVDTTTGIAKIKLTLENGNSDFNGNYVTVSVMVPGEHSGIEVVYTDGSAEQPILLGCSFDASTYMTKVTFKTSHFSEFEIRVTGEEFITVGDSEALKNAITNTEADSFTVLLKDGTYTTNFQVNAGKNITIIGNGDKTILKGQIFGVTKTLSIENLTYVVDSTINDSTGISQTGKSAIGIWNDLDLFVNNVTFDVDPSYSDSTVITTWWSTGDGANIIVKNSTFNCGGQRPIRSDASVTVENCVFNDPYRYAVQMTSKTNTISAEGNAVVNFFNNMINNGANGKDFVYGVQLEGETYGCSDLTINGSGNTINKGSWDTGNESTLYYCECGKTDHSTIEWNNTDSEPTHKETGAPE